MGVVSRCNLKDKKEKDKLQWCTFLVSVILGMIEDKRCLSEKNRGQ